MLGNRNIRPTQRSALASILFPSPSTSSSLSPWPFWFIRLATPAHPSAISHHPELSLALHCPPIQADALQLDIQGSALSGLNLPDLCFHLFMIVPYLKQFFKFNHIPSLLKTLLRLPVNWKIKSKLLRLAFRTGVFLPA